MADPASTLAELSTLVTRLEELSKRVTDVAEQYSGTPDSRIASDLFSAERALHGAHRSLLRAAEQLKIS